MRAVRLAAELGIDKAVPSGCSRRSVFRWSALYSAGGIEALIPQSRARRQAQASLPEWVSRVTVTIRLATYWNSKRIAAEKSDARSTRSATPISMSSSGSMAAAVAAWRRYRARDTNGVSRTSFGTSTSKALSSSSSLAEAT